MGLSKTLYPGDADSGAQDFKLVEFARAFRSESIRDLKLEVRMQGFYATAMSTDPTKSSLEKSAVFRDMVDVESRLVELGVPSQAIFRTGVAQSPLKARQIELTTGQKSDSTLSYHVPQAVQVVPNLPSAGSGGIRPLWEYATGSAEAGAEFDPLEKESQNKIRTVIEISFKHNGALKMQTITTSFTIGTDGRLIEVGTDLTLFKAEYNINWAKGLSTDLKFAVKATAAYGLTKGEWETKMKTTLSVDLNIPKTSLKFAIQGTGYVDFDGKVGPGLNFSLSF